MRSFTTTLAYFQTILLINGTVNTSAFVVLPSRSITTKLHAGRAPTGAELLKKTFDDASASAETISASKSSGGDAPNFFSYVSEDKKVSDLIGKLADASDNKSQYGIKGDTPTLASFFSNNDNIQQLGSVSKQNAAALKDSLNQVSPALENTLGAISKSFADLTATLSGFGNSFSQLKSSSTNGAGGDLAGKFNGFWDSLQIAENGPIYVAGVAILVAGLNNRAKGNEVAEAQAKVIEAADAAELAAKGANLTKQLAENADAAASKKAEELIAEKRTIELEVSKLKLESTKALETADKATKDASFAKEKSRALDIEASKKASEVKIDKEMMEVTISKLKVENTMAKEAAETATKEVSIAKEAVEKTNAEASSKAKGFEAEKETMEAEMSKLKAEITKATEEASIAKETVEKTNAEASSKAKGFEGEKETMEAEMSKLKAEITKATEEASIAKETVEKTNAEASSKARGFEAEKETMEAEMSKLKAEITKAAETSQDAAAKEASISKEMTESIDAKARDEVKALEAEKEMMKAEILKLQAGTTELKRAVELLTMTAKEKIATSTASEKTAAELLMEETNKGTRFVAKTSAGSEGNPWGSLKESTLKGRTKIQLTAYLEERNIDVTGMKKADLVNKIINL
eukprot:CAMPEP_0198276130 /NCGR_PEP_ID=MMETSP1447-20131203/65144_1 /TAXON_ID=420782 /ORGANISM="Chaetoceros dichaeta, Strain CCMP1751" /LENGTH=637 /DNA_ID=CAMNT_0043971051 /DNA_START=47 /DNA_END=1960 /DNA_ORIENTATION=-